MPKFNARLTIKVVVDLVLLLIPAITVLIFYIHGDPFLRGFACDDTSIRYPYKESTVTALSLYLYGTLIPVVAILVVEYCHAFRGSNSLNGSNLKIWFWSLYGYLGAFLFGCAMSQTIVDICKYAVGRLRPHFIEVCGAEDLAEYCKTSPYAVVGTDGNPCRLETEPYLIKRQKESRLSFISGHASFSMFTMVYLILYLQHRFDLPNFPLVRPILQQLCFVIALYTGLSRVMDCKHHWSDVFAGSFNGLVFGVLIGLFVANFFKKKNCSEIVRKTEDFSLQDNSAVSALGQP